MTAAPATHATALLQRLVAQRPDAVAFIDGERRITVAEFDALVQRTAAWLAGRGVGRGDVVAVWLVNRLEWLALYFALARRGAALMTVNTRYRGAEVAYLLQKSRPKAFVLQLNFRKIDFPAVLREVDPAAAATVEQVWVVGAGDAEGALPATVLGKPARAFDLAALPAATVPDDSAPDAPSIFFTTSGTTSGPKLVVHTQATVARHVQRVATTMGLDAPGAVLLAALPFGGVFGFDSTLGALAGGAPIVLTPTFDAGETLRLIAAHAVTHFFGSDEMFEAVLALAPGDRSTPGWPLAGLRLCGYAAFRAGAAAVAEAACARGLPMAGLYGSSEVHALFSIQAAPDPRIGFDRPLAQRLEGGGVPTNPAAEIRVRDVDTGALLPPGQAGLLEIRSDSNFAGYLHHPEATAAAIDAEGFFRTGDIGLLRDGDPQGSFVYLTRHGDAIRLAGYLVAPADIEEELKAAPGVASAQVVALDIAGKSRAVAFVIAQPGATVDPAAVIAHAEARMAAFKVPARVWVVDAFPVVNSANGTKIQRNKLRELAQQRVAAEAG